jgi:hypothetical protein
VGSEQPIQGWYSVDHHRKAAAPAICYEARSSAAKVLVTLLYPVSNIKHEDKASIDILDVSDGASIACVVESKHGKDYLLLSKNRQMKSFGPYESDAVLAGYRTNNNGVTKRRFAWYGDDRVNGE